VNRRPLIALLVLLAATVGCGADNEAAEAPPPLPDLTVPQTDADESTGTETTPPVTETTPPATTEAAPEPQPETVPDSPANDTPPPADSPAERFEEFCNENPGACG
jgi:hypothetical protein